MSALKNEQNRKFPDTCLMGIVEQDLSPCAVGITLWTAWLTGRP